MSIDQKQYSTDEFVKHIKQDIRKSKIGIKIDKKREKKLRSSYKDLANEIVLAYEPRIRLRVAKVFGSNKLDYEELVNEIMLTAIDKLENGLFRGDSSLGTILYTITSRKIVDYIREKSKSLKYSPDITKDSSSNEQADDEERAKLIQKHLAKLKPKYKEILYLYMYKELSREEVAKKLGITPRRVSERFNYAQKLLQKMMKY